MASRPLAENIWLDKHTYDAAECQYFQGLAKGPSNTSLPKISLAGEVAKARQHIKNSLECIDNVASSAAKMSLSDNLLSEDLSGKFNQMEKLNAVLNAKVEQLTSDIRKLEARVVQVEGRQGVASNALPASSAATEKKPAADDDDDDGVDLFGSDSEEESEEAKKMKEARVNAYAAKKSKKPALIAKSNIILDVKPWDDETDMKKLEAAVRAVTCDGLLWGASKLVPLAYGIHKLQISCVVEDEKVSIDWLQETIEANEDFIQSVDIAAFNKV